MNNKTSLCQQCFIPFYNISTLAKYCSRYCYVKAKWTRRNIKKSSLGILYDSVPVVFINRKCKQCNSVIGFKRNRKDCKYIFCSLECLYKYNTKYLDIPDCLESPDRKLDKNIGYVRIYVPMHPEANTWGYVYEHRIIAEQKIGRRLEKNEVVHHVNGKRWDNRPENLEVMDRIEHSKLPRH